MKKNKKGFLEGAGANMEGKDRKGFLARGAGSGKFLDQATTAGSEKFLDQATTAGKAMTGSTINKSGKR